ncbi:MAG: M3 family metallopeptidase, partial [Promethearchaeota archaeon]
MAKKEIKWDFSEMFSGFDDPKLPLTMENLTKEADQFVKDYKGKISSKDFRVDDLNILLKKIEDFSARLDEIQLFAINSFNANMTLPETQALNNKYREFQTQISTKLAFVDLEIGKLVYENKEIISNQILENYKHHLETIYRAFPHQLSEIEEQIIIEKDQHGIRAWSQLQGAWLNTREFKVMVEGEEKVLSYGEANNLFTHPDRNTRISANKSIYGLLGNDEEIFTTALRNICSDWIKNSKRRSYDSPMHDSLIVNDTTQQIIDSLVKTMEESVGVYQRYLKIKAKLLNLPKLTCADVIAPLLNVPHKKYGWEEAKELIFEALSRFDESFVENAKDMFEKKHIDASIRKGKRNGAYCAGWYKGKSAFILMSFDGAIREVYTLTHELGHAIHDYLASREQTYINVHPGYTVAETASTFGELLMTDLLLEKANSKQEKMAIIAHVLDEAGQAAFQVSARIWFEQSLYDAIEKGEHLDGKTVSKYWCAGRDKIYGDSVEWFEEMNWEWTMKGHYYIPNFRFYNYPY